MKINTLQFGEVEITKEQIITFANGIPAFEDLRKFAIIELDEEVPFSYMQSVDDGDLFFLITNPFLFEPTYDVQLPESVVEELDIQSEGDVSVWAIVTVPEQLKDATMNLLAPIIINCRNNLGKQVILHDTHYKTKQHLITEQKKSLSEGDEIARTNP